MAVKIRVVACDVPSDSIFHGSLPRIDYRDAFAAQFRSPRELVVDDAYRAFFRTVPRWISALMRLRNAIVKRLGLKYAQGVAPESLERLPIAKGSATGLFQVYEVGPGEILSGEDDKHLDFRVLVRLERLAAQAGAGEYRLLVATDVRFRNILGRLYFVPVGIFHRLIVPAMVRAIVKDLSASGYPADSGKKETSR